MSGDVSTLRGETGFPGNLSLGPLCDEFPGRRGFIS